MKVLIKYKVGVRTETHSSPHYYTIPETERIKRKAYHFEERKIFKEKNKKQTFICHQNKSVLIFWTFKSFPKI